MGKYIIQRLLIFVPVLIGVTLFVYLFVDLAPGDPVAAMMDPEFRASQEWMDRERERLGLNKPWLSRYALWLQEVAQGNLGYSLVSHKAVAQEIGRLFPRTLVLATLALVLSTVIGLTVGVVGALKQYSLIDHSLTFLSFGALSVPNFFLSLVLIYVFALRLDILPSGGTRTIGQEGVWDSLTHLILPAIGLGAPLTAGLARYVRSSVLDVIRQDSIRTARAKGLSERIVTIRHILRNSLLPSVTIIGMRMPYLLAGSVIIEHVFFWPGLGQMGMQAVLGQDYPVIMGFNLVIAMAVLVSNLVTDMVYAFIDPRIRYAG